jgi:hypothetical protein
MNIRKVFLGLTLVSSVLVGTITALYHERLFNKCEVDVTLPENWKRISVQEKLESLDRLLLKNATFPLVSEIRQLNIRKQLTKMIIDKEDDVLRGGRQYRFAFRFFVGWEELVLLGLLGFASVWVIYGSVRVLTLLIPSAPLRQFPSPALRERVESLNFPMWREPAGLASVRITLFGALALEERPKRLKKPAAVWID